MLAPIAPRHSHRASASELIAAIIAYVELLLDRWDAASEQRPSRHVPVARTRLEAWGVPDAILVWMMYQVHVEHLRPVSARSQCSTVWTPADSLVLRPSSGFRLTEPGAAFAEDWLASMLVPNQLGERREALSRFLLGDLLPSYDRSQRIFKWGRTVLKCFRQPSGNQERLLLAAEEMGWCEWFDDPLPRVPATNPKHRLHDTIKDLNRRQFRNLVHFKGDGTGTRVGWDFR